MKYGKDIEKQTLLLTDKYKDFVQNFNCGNEVMNDYLKETFMKTSTSLFLDGCIPMYMDL